MEELRELTLSGYIVRIVCVSERAHCKWGLNKSIFNRIYYIFIVEV